MSLPPTAWAFDADDESMVPTAHRQVRALSCPVGLSARYLRQIRASVATLNAA